MTHHIKYSDMCIVGDEIEGKSSQKGDGHISGTLHICEKKLLPNLKRPTKRNVLH